MNALKDKGNAALQSNEPLKAIEFYSEAIAIDGNNHVLYSNRSAAYCKAEMYDEALKDAEKCIDIKSDWARGYSRKGNALEFLSKYLEAKAAYVKGLEVILFLQIAMTPTLLLFSVFVFAAATYLLHFVNSQYFYPSYLSIKME